MGFIGRVLEFVGLSQGGDQLSEVKVNPGSGSPRQAQHFQPAGIDSQPALQDAAVCIDADGVDACLGYADTVNAGEAGPGEIILKSRDGGGAIVARIKVLSDGTVEIVSDGTVTINGAEFSSSGALTVPSATIGGIDFGTHVHSNPEGGFTGGPAGPP